MSQIPNDGPPSKNLRIRPIRLGNGALAYRPEDKISTPHLVFRTVTDVSLDGTVDQYNQVVKLLETLIAECETRVSKIT